MVKSDQLRRQKKNAMVIDDAAEAPSSRGESFQLPDGASASMVLDVKQSAQSHVTNKKASGIRQVAGSTHNSRIKQKTARPLSAKKLRMLRTQEKHKLAEEKRAREFRQRKAELQEEEKAQKVYVAEQRRQQGIVQKQDVDNVSHMFSHVL